jgi:hypothetical protein
MLMLLVVLLLLLLLFLLLSPLPPSLLVSVGAFRTSHLYKKEQ